jgi:hypothetical protein
VDCCGNVGTCAQSITMVDTTPPTLLACPSDTAVYSCSISNLFSSSSPATGTCLIELSSVYTTNWWTVMATDTCSGVSFALTPTNGSILYLGTTNLVRCVATDACGNTNICAFNIAVVRPPLGNPAITYAAGWITITWTDGGELQGADNVLGPYTDITETSPYTVQANLAHRFYRLHCVLPGH